MNKAARLWHVLALALFPIHHAAAIDSESVKPVPVERFAPGGEASLSLHFSVQIANQQVAHGTSEIAVGSPDFEAFLGRHKNALQGLTDDGGASEGIDALANVLRECKTVACVLHAPLGESDAEGLTVLISPKEKAHARDGKTKITGTVSLTHIARELVQARVAGEPGKGFSPYEYQSEERAKQLQELKQRIRAKVGTRTEGPLSLHENRGYLRFLQKPVLKIISFLHKMKQSRSGHK